MDVMNESWEEWRKKITRFLNKVFHEWKVNSTLEIKYTNKASVKNSCDENLFLASSIKFKYCHMIKRKNISSV